MDGVASKLGDTGPQREAGSGEQERDGSEEPDEWILTTPVPCCPAWGVWNCVGASCVPSHLALTSLCLPAGGRL